MLLNLEEEKKNFENHEATFQDLGNIKILDFKRPESLICICLRSN